MHVNLQLNHTPLLQTAEDPCEWSKDWLLSLDLKKYVLLVTDGKIWLKVTKILAYPVPAMLKMCYPHDACDLILYSKTFTRFVITSYKE